MTVSEYEDRFRIPATSLHQIFAEIQSLNRTRRRRRHCLVAAASLVIMTLTVEIASNHAAHSPMGNGSAREPAFEVLSREFWHILDRVSKRLQPLAGPLCGMPDGQKSSRLG